MGTRIGRNKDHDDLVRLWQTVVDNDDRYKEISVERDKALKIKETADLAALQLARDQQTYKDEQANELREQINRERNLYASKEDLGNAIDKLANTTKDASARQLATIAAVLSAISLITFIYAVLTRGAP